MTELLKFAFKYFLWIEVLLRHKNFVLKCCLMRMKENFYLSAIFTTVIEFQNKVFRRRTRAQNIIIKCENFRPKVADMKSESHYINSPLLDINMCDLPKVEKKSE